MPPEITRSISIGELVMNYPSAVEVLFSHGFHCIGCGLSAYETLEQGAAAHGYDDGMIDQIVTELREAAKNAVESEKKPAAIKSEIKAKQPGNGLSGSKIGGMKPAIAKKRK